MRANNGLTPENINFTILIVIACVILLIIFSTLTILWKRYEANRETRNKRNNELAVNAQRKNNVKFVSGEINKLFDFYNKKILDRDENKEVSNVSMLNAEAKQIINSIMSSSKYRWLINDETNELYEGAIFLEELSKINATLWEKKYGNKIRELYGK